MKGIEIIDEQILRATDLLEQIKSVNEMIALHQQKGDPEDLMLIQYKYRRARFLKELTVLLSELNISPSDLAA
ncbi:MAG: hypothetical protein WA960_15850 [Tunicatimonas sp.]